MKKLLLIVFLLSCWSSVPEAQETRQFYISPIDGAGTDENSLHSRCFGVPGANSIKLTPWGINRYLCASDSLPANMTGVIQIGASLNVALGARKTALENLVGKSLAATTVREALIEIIGPKLRAGRDGKLKMYLTGKDPTYQQTAWVPFPDGGLVADVTNYAKDLLEPSLAWAASHTDNFNVADNAVLSGQLTWTEMIGTLYSTASNMARYSGGTGTAEGRADVDLDTDDMRVGVTIAGSTTGSATALEARVFARQENSATRTHYGFRAFIIGGGGTACRLYERTAGTIADLTSASCTATTNDHLELVVDGTTLTAYLNSSVIVGPTTDASISGFLRGGISANADHATGVIDQDNFHIADETAAATGRNRGAVWLN